MPRVRSGYICGVAAGSPLEPTQRGAGATGVVTPRHPPQVFPDIAGLLPKGFGTTQVPGGGVLRRIDEPYQLPGSPFEIPRTVHNCDPGGINHIDLWVYFTNGYFKNYYLPIEVSHT